jgi:3-oxoacyl-[acyl-carrier-protein] synthase-3
VQEAIDTNWVAPLISSQNGFCEIGKFIFGTDGKGAENLIVKNGAVRNKIQQNEDIVDEYVNVRNDNNLYMNGSEIFSFTSESVPKLTTAILDKIDKKIEDIDLYIFHQANKYMLNHLRKKIGIPEDKFFLAMKHCGNTVSSIIPIALYEAIKSNRIEDCKKHPSFGIWCWIFLG